MDVGVHACRQHANVGASKVETVSNHLVSVDLGFRSSDNPGALT